MKMKPISGFPEWLPGQRLLEEKWIDTIRQSYQLFGFVPIETPAVERMEVLTAKGGMQRQLYTLGRPEEGGRDSEADLGLHFDLTVPLARYVVQHAQELSFPFRRYQIQKVWRGERKQQGRFREFYQCDIDIVGRTNLDLLYDAEIPCAINATFSALNIPNFDFKVRLSNRKILAALIRTKHDDPDFTTRILRVIDKTERDGLDKTRADLQTEGIDANLLPAVIDLIQCDQIAAARQILQLFQADLTGLEELATVWTNAQELGMPAERLVPDFAIARGLDYYTGTIYETVVKGYEAWGSICSGGRYDDLAGYFTQETFPGVGISIGLSRLLARLLDAGFLTVSRAAATFVLVTMQDRKQFLSEYLQLARDLRAAGIPSEVYLGQERLRDQFGYADAIGIPYVLIAGEQEFANQTVLLRNLKTREQQQLPRATWIAHLRQQFQNEVSNALPTTST